MIYVRVRKQDQVHRRKLIKSQGSSDMAFRSERHHARIHSNTLNEDRIRKDAHAIEIDQHRRVATQVNVMRLLSHVSGLGVLGAGKGLPPKSRAIIRPTRARREP